MTMTMMFNLMFNGSKLHVITGSDVVLKKWSQSHSLSTAMDCLHGFSGMTNYRIDRIDPQWTTSALILTTSTLKRGAEV